MATPTGISVSNNYFIAQEDTSAWAIPQSGAALGVIVAAPITGEVGVGQKVMYLNTSVTVFSQSSESFAVIPIKNILATYTAVAES